MKRGRHTTTGSATHAGRPGRRIAVVACVLALFACGDGDDVPVTLRPFEAVTVGEQHSCGLAESGEAYCWGDGENGALGTGTRDTERFAVPVAGELLFTALAAGGAHTCGLTADGTAYCWGANSDGQLGIVRAGDVLAPEPVETDVRFASIAAGWSHTCAIDLTGTAYCWGRGTSGELGTGAFPATIPNPTAVATTLSFDVISAGGRHSCGVTTDNDAWCWGANDVGQLGNDGDGTPAPAPVQVDLGANFTGISAGYNHSCAVAANGNAYCWGQNGNGQLGNLDIADTRRPARVFAPGNEPYVQVSAGRHYSCGLLTTGMMMCWGLNSSGQLGNTGTSQTTIRQPVYVEPGRRFRWDGGAYASFDAGGAHTCAVTTDAIALCWGQGDRGQLGSGEWSSMIPHPVR